MLQHQFKAPWINTFQQCIDGELAASNNSPPFTTFLLATVDKDGFPHNRTLIYRGFLFDDKSTNVLTFATDKRMEKYDELMHNDRYEAVFYFAKLQKQFRFRGRARIVDENRTPVIDLTNVQPTSPIYKKTSASDTEDEEDEDIIELKVEKKSPVPEVPITDVQSTPLQSAVVSRTLVSKVTNALGDVSFTHLHDLSGIDLFPPTKEEWQEERNRQWQTLSKNLKKSFRKPTPKTKMDDSNRKLIDSIGRGVDGKKEIDGFKNFCFVGLFVDQVDYVELEKDRRYIYDLDDYQQWTETEVCT